VVLEGAGGAAEVNLLDRDIVNLPLAAAERIPVVLVGDIERGGVFASLYGTVALLPERLRACVRGFVINRFRGDRSLLEPGIGELEARTGVPVLGVLPLLADIAGDDEDSMDVSGFGSPSARVDVAVIRLPRISNFTDLDPFRVEPDVRVRYVAAPEQLGRPDLVVVPGTKATVADLAWLRAVGLDSAVDDCGAVVVGVCGGWQMLGRRIVDVVESGAGAVEGLGWTDAETVFEADKVVRRGEGGRYEIHHGRVEPRSSWSGRVRGTVEHGLFDDDRFRRQLVAELGGVPGVTAWSDHRAARFDRIADALEAELDLAMLERLWS
jgi:adenosylcobyric acid synthase